MTENQILAVLDPAVRRELLSYGREVRYDQRTVLYGCGGRMEEVFFPSSGVISLFVELEEGRRADVAMVGREGALGVEAAFGVVRHTHAARGEVEGSGWALSASKIVEMCQAAPLWRNQLARSCAYISAQAQQIAACNAHHNAVQRLATWLLRISEKIEDNSLFVTQERIAEALGLQRATLSGAAGNLADEGGIEYRRGRVNILAREILSNRACECHRTISQAAKDILAAPTDRS